MLPELWHHQKEALHRAKYLDEFALFFDVGTGKTRTTIEWLQTKYEFHNNKMLTLVFCPPIVIENWANEFRKFSDKRDFVLLTGTALQRKKQIEDAFKENPYQIFITNYEFCSNHHMLETFNIFTKLLRQFNIPKAIVADEGHKIKNPTSARTKGMLYLSKLFQYRILLTGTPYLSSLEDLWSQFFFLDHGKALGANFWSFKKKYFVDMNMGTLRGFPNWQAIPGAKENIQELTHNKVAVARRHDCLNLPPLQKIKVEFEMSIDQKALYSSMKKDMLASLTQNGDKYEAVANMALTKALRLQQITTGHVTAEHKSTDLSTVEEKVIKVKENPRIKVLQELIESVIESHKVIVWAVFTDNIDDIVRLCEKNNWGYAEVHGAIKDKDSEIKKFTERSDIKIMIGNPTAGGIGINLVEASVMIYYSRNFSLESDVQSEARCFRAGSEIHDKILRYDIVAKGTIDELVSEAVDAKSKISNDIIERYFLGAM